MGNLFNFGKKRIILTIILSILFILIAIYMTSFCPLLQRVCPADSTTPGAYEYFNGEYGVNAKDVPLSCDQACSIQGYILSLMKNILLKIILPVIISYLLSCLILFSIESNKPE